VSDEVCLPSLDEFLAWEWPLNSYIDEPGFTNLYLRKADIGVWLDGEHQICTRVITIANVQTESYGQGILTRFVEKLVAKGYAVCVENAHLPRFQAGLLRRGFVLCSLSDPTFLFNFDGHLQKI
jgi:hypothetical protein